MATHWCRQLLSLYALYVVNKGTVLVIENLISVEAQTWGAPVQVVLAHTPVPYLCTQHLGTCHGGDARSL